MLHHSAEARKLRDLDVQARQRALLSQHFDANDTAFLERELTQLRAKLFTVAFPELLSKQFLPMANDIAPSAETFAFKVLKPIGDARIVAGSSAPNDIPRVDVVAREVTGKVRDIVAMYGWKINELREAARIQMPLAEVKARAARNAIERGVDNVLATGDLAPTPQGQTNPECGGLVNNADVVTQGILTQSNYFSSPNNVTILNDLNTWVASLANNSQNLFDTNAVLMPVQHYKYVSQTPYNTTSGATILDMFLNGNKAIKTVQPWWRLKLANVAGTGGRAIAYQMDPQVLEGIAPQGFEQLPPEQRGLEFQIICTARAGGVKVYQPLGMKYADFP